MNTIRGTMLALLMALAALAPGGTPYQDAFEKGDTLWKEDSFQLAHVEYEKAQQAAGTAEEKRWAAFRLADSDWRSDAASETSDSSRSEAARQALEAMVRDVQREDQRDRLWAEVQESLGDYQWTRKGYYNYGGAQSYYQAALDWWAASRDLELARERYLRLVHRIAEPPFSGGIDGYFYGYYGNYVPAEVLTNALTLARDDDERAFFHYLLARSRQQMNGYDPDSHVIEEYEAALALGKKTKWYDDALYNYATYLVSPGRAVMMDNGNFRWEPDYNGALKLYERFLKEFQKGESRYVEAVANQVRDITSGQLSVYTSNVFLPEGGVSFQANWRNIQKIHFTLRAIDLTRDIAYHNPDLGASNWLQEIDAKAGKVAKEWDFNTNDKGDHAPGNKEITLDEPLPAGAYLLLASAEVPASPAWLPGGLTASTTLEVRDLLLVTDASVVFKSARNKAVAWACDAQTGAPLGAADVSLWCRQYNGNWSWKHWDLKTDDAGLATTTPDQDASQGEYFVAINAGGRQAFALDSSYWREANNSDQWKLYVVTDRAAYRPGEEASWKVTARTSKGEAYVTPNGATLSYEIFDPRSQSVAKGDMKLNAFGSAWDVLKLTDKMSLGEYRITFFTPDRNGAQVGSATLLRLEEYKLPEFKVSVKLPEKDGHKKTYRLGETVDVEIAAEYYFGGPVAGADVQVVARSTPWYRAWPQPHEFPWFYEGGDVVDMPMGRPSMDSMIRRPPRPYGGDGQVVKQESLKTDEKGIAHISIPTQRTGQDVEFRIEARVVDKSRREIVGQDTVRVTRNRYAVQLNPDHYIFHPQDRVAISVKAADSNDNPVAIDGDVTIQRSTWVEIWVAPDGKVYRDEALRTYRASCPVFPPAPEPGRRPWRQRFSGYEYEDVLSQKVKTDADGKAEIAFVAPKDGYYTVNWVSPDPGAPMVRTSTTAWVATGASSDLGYHAGGLEMILDKDTFKAGQKAPVMLVAPTNDRYVLFSVQGESLHDVRVIHMTGTAKLVEVDLDDRHIPNTFLEAVMVTGAQISTQAKEVVVPPVKNFLTVDVSPDKAEYMPRDSGTLRVQTKDAEGKPVSAEVALALVDEAVSYIQSDYAMDPRQFFYGSKKGLNVRTTSSFNQKAYIRLEDRRKQREDDSRQWKAQGMGADRDEEQVVAYASNPASAPSPAAMAESMDMGAVGGLAMQKSKGGNNAPARMRAMKDDKSVSMEKKEAAAPAEPNVIVRTDFRSTILWQPDVVTGPDGTASVQVKYPDSTTSWKATGRAASQGAQFGVGTGSARTRMPLIVRLEAPRFLVAGDEATLSAVINNNTSKELEAQPSLKADGLEFDPKAAPLKIPAGGEARADWKVKAVHPADALKLKVQAVAGEFADAMEKAIPVCEHGVDKYLASSGKMSGDALSLPLDIPKERRPGSTEVTVNVSTSIASTMLDALPYLIDYPYGCTEQTMSRFLPTAIVAKTLGDLQIPRETIAGRLFGGIEAASADKTHTHGLQDLARMDDMARAGIKRLQDLQHSDGGWGWWKDGESDPFMTAYVVWGLSLGRSADLSLPGGMLDRGADFLATHLVNAENDYDLQAWMLQALSAHHHSMNSFETTAYENLWEHRDRLKAYGTALLALSAHSFGRKDDAAQLARNLENGVRLDEDPGKSLVSGGGPSRAAATAHWGEERSWWRWNDGGVETTAFVLRALVAIDPANHLVDPAVNWLVRNRRGAQWNNTRDTAMVVLAMADYLRQTKELGRDAEFELLVNGTSAKRQKLVGRESLGAPVKITIEEKLLRDGANDIVLRRVGGDASLYGAAAAKFFSLEEPVKAAGSELFVRREYYRLAAAPTLLKGIVFERQPLRDGDTIISGERVETILTIETKNDAEYLLFEDLKPAGFEAVELRSGESQTARELKSSGAARVLTSKGKAQADDTEYTGRQRWVYEELRDRKVALFLDKLPQGTWRIQYEMRAEVPGTFHALPLLGQAMYVPEIRANSDETRVTVKDR